MDTQKQEVGVCKKDRFYGKGIHKIYPSALLARYFKGKEDVKCERSGNYTFYFWKGKQYATDGNIITVKYQDKYERPSFDTYLDCLNDAKEYLSEKYSDGQMKLDLS